MKWIFLLLIMANAAYVAWQSVAAADKKVEQDLVYAPPVSEKIYLIDEEAAPTDAPIQTPAIEAPALVQVAEAEAVVEKVQEAIQKAEVKQQVDVKQPVEVKPEAVAAAPKQDLLCPLIELEKDSDRSLVEVALKSRKLAYKKSETTGKRDKYWLYIAAPATTAQAQDIVSRLKLKRIESYVIARGDMKNRISLGLFSSKDRAEQAQQSIASQSGMKVQIYEHQRSVSIYQLLISKPVEKKSWMEFEQSLDMSKLLIKIEKNPC